MGFYENRDVRLKGRLQKIFSKDTIMLHKHGSGDGSGSQGRGRCCKLCGDDQNLRRLGDTYMREGVIERYDCLLSDCFGVKVAHSRSMICEQCIYQLRSTERFRALVHAAFDRRSSDYSSTNTLQKRHDVNSTTTTSQTLSKDFEGNIPKDKTYRNIQLWGEKIAKPKTWQIKNRNVLPITKHATKKVNVSCIVCCQRYRMTIPLEGTANFICCDCKISQECRNVICKRCNFTIPSDLIQKHMNMHSRANYRRSNRNRSVLNNSSKTRKTEGMRKIESMYQELQKKYVQDSNNCKFCGKYMKTQQLLDKHVTRVHLMSTYRCKDCIKIFKNKREWQIHCLKHKKD